MRVCVCLRIGPNLDFFANLFRYFFLVYGNKIGYRKGTKYIYKQQQLQVSRVFHQPNVTCLLVCNSVRRGQNVQNEIRRKGLFLQMLLHTNVTVVCSSGSRKENTHLSMWNQNDQSSHQRVKTLCIIPYIFLKTKAEEGLQTSDLQS